LCFYDNDADVDDDDDDDELSQTEIDSFCHFSRHSYLCLSVPAMALPAGPEPPGPGSYDIHSSFNDSRKTDAKTAVFVSTTTRWNADTSNNNFPSPG